MDVRAKIEQRRIKMETSKKGKKKQVTAVLKPLWRDTSFSNLRFVKRHLWT